MKYYEMGPEGQRIEEERGPQFTKENIRYNQHIMTIDNFLPEWSINQLLETWKVCEEEGYVYPREDKHCLDHLNIKDTGINFQEIPKTIPNMRVPNLEEIIRWVDGPGIEAYHAKYDVLNIDTYRELYVSGAKMQRTNPGEGYHIWHHEHGRMTYVKNSMMAWMVYLNDIEEGGETEFLYQHVRVKPKAGQLVMWPAFFTHMHRGNPPLKDDKYVITGWIDYF